VLGLQHQHNHATIRNVLAGMLRRDIHAGTALFHSMTKPHEASLRHDVQLQLLGS
jgi:hypothetical protein